MLESSAITSDEAKALRAQIQELSDQFAIMRRMYEDLFYNIDAGNLSEAMGRDYNSTLTEVWPDGVTNTSSITQTADKLEAEVTRIDNEIGSFDSKITQTADAIVMSVTAQYSNPVTVSSMSQFTDKKQLYHLVNYYYYWDNINNTWVQTANANFGTVFQQTAGGFYLKGNVTLDGNLIDNGDITGGTIDGATLRSVHPTSGLGIYISQGVLEIIAGNTVLGYIGADTNGDVVIISNYPNANVIIQQGGVMGIAATREWVASNFVHL